MSDDRVRLVKRAELRLILGVSVDTLRRWLDAGKLPKPCTDLGAGQQWWHPQDLEAAGIRLTPAAASQPTPAASESAPA